MGVIRFNFLSKELGMQTNVSICIPTFSFADMYNNRTEVYIPGMKFQVLYLLHGGSGDDSDFIHFSNIVRYADENQVAVVMPCDYNACYTDAPDGPKYYSYLVEELPRICASMFPISDKREDTFIGGLSMGSHGAMKIAMNYPERFAAALFMSGASFRPGVPTFVPTKDGIFDLETPPQQLPFNSVGDKLQDPEYIKGTVNDVFAIARENAQCGKKLPKLFFRVGDCDHAYYRAQLAEKDLKSWGYETKFEVVKGMGHEWDLWDSTLRLALREWLPLKRSAIYPDEQ